MRRIILESTKSDITRTLINNGFNIRGCEVEEFDDKGNYRLVVKNHSEYSYLGLEYSVDEQKIYVDYVEKGSQQEIEKDFRFPGELSSCVQYWNNLI